MSVMGLSRNRDVEDISLDEDIIRRSTVDGKTEQKTHFQLSDTSILM